MLTRRTFLSRTARASAAACLLPLGCARRPADDAPAPGVVVNDIHSQLNETTVSAIERPATADELAELVRRVASQGQSMAVCGGRHAMGGQQFAQDRLLVDTAALAGTLDLDDELGQVEAGAGLRWPELHARLQELQADDPPGPRWGIRQKQSGADRLSLGGALAANAHSRRLRSRPIVEDVEAFTLIDAEGHARRCSRTENPDLFGLAIGGYGLFGIMTSVRLRLERRRKVERVVEIADARDLAERLERRAEAGYLFGDFQYATDYASKAGLREGVLSCYRPVDDDAPLTDAWKGLGASDWLELVRLAHTDPAQAFKTYSAYYLTTNGQVYWSDAHQFSTYVDDYHAVLGDRLGRDEVGGEMITELYVPRSELAAFLETIREDFRVHHPNLIYGTIRLIEREHETFLNWAREPWACVIVNLHVGRATGEVMKAADDFRRLIDRALERGGSYFLTYHRWALREQLLAAYPKFPEFVARKRAMDPGEVFTSDWYVHQRQLLEDSA